MERLRQLLIDISAQLSVLTVSQRIAIGLCAALAAGSLLWLLQWSTAPEMVPLLTHEFTYDELDAAEQSLQANDIPHMIRGTRIYVRSADRVSLAMPAGLAGEDVVVSFEAESNARIYVQGTGEFSGCVLDGAAMTLGRVRNDDGVPTHTYDGSPADSQQHSLHITLAADAFLYSVRVSTESP